MLFNSIEFIFVFLPVVFVLFYVCPAKFRLAILFFSSLAFYAASGDLALLLLVMATAWAVPAAFLVQRWNVGLVAVVAVLPPLGFLILFKYLDFSISILDPSGETRDFFSFILRYTIPAGISFYTFQIVSYLIDVRRGTVPVERNPLLIGTFVTLFPQLIAGPILRFHEIRDQLRHISETAKLRPNIARAVKYFTIGLTFKIFFADVLKTVQEQHKIEAGAGILDTVYAVFAYSFIIYFDFWSYSLMAIGLAGLFCLRLPRNFREPYLAKTPKDFWRRWHVTLSFWLRDYVYIPIGGNRRYVANITIVFILCGIWHGAGWNFIVWGAYHALLIIVYRLTHSFWDRQPAFLQVSATFVAVSLGWPLFYLDVAGYIDMLSMHFVAKAPTNALQFGIWHWLYLAGIACWTFLTREDRWLFNETPNRLFDSPFLHGVLFSASVLFMYFGQTFIYFNF